MYNASVAIPGGVTPAGQVVVDLPCRKCGYNLRGLTVNGRCPECGTAVGFSAQGDYLRFSSPEWLDTMANGVRLVIIGAIVLIVGSFVITIVAASARTGPLPVVLLQLAAFVLMTIGWWALTEPDPSGLGEDRYGTSRKLIRIGLIGGMVDQVLDLTGLAGPFPPAGAMAIAILKAVTGLLSIVSFFAQMNYARKLSLRVPDRAIAARAKFLIWAFPITFVVLIVVAIVAGGTGGAGGLVATLVPSAAILVFAIMYLLMISRLGRRFREAAVTARTSWARTVAAPGTAGAGASDAFAQITE